MARLPSGDRGGSDTAADAQLVTRALGRAGEALRLSPQQLSSLLGADASGAESSDVTTPAGQRSLLVLRLYRSLVGLVGSDPAARIWLRSHNASLKGAPEELIMNSEGLRQVVEYLEAMQAKN